MNENEIAIPFDVKTLQENTIANKINKIKSLARAFVFRLLDIVIALFGSLLLFPLILIVFIENLKNKDYGPVFYKQERIGKNGKLFTMYKFRTMRVGADKELATLLKENKKLAKEYATYKKLKDDPRLTKIGAMLRRTSLDEFPQFINVLKGEMSIVGPRPYTPDEIEDMGTYYNYIIQHKPGITGVYQISGRERVTFLDRLDADYRYHYNKGFWTDFKIAIITIFITFRRKNIFELKDLTYTTIKDVFYILIKYLNLFVKRCIDIIGAIVGILILIPLTAVVAIVNFVSKEHGPLFYSQERIGKDGKHFKMYKFRSMVVNAEEVLEKMLNEDEEVRAEFEATRKLKNDPRITKIGKILRKTSLDEFPQFINVLKGEMSLVGPRAVIDGEIELFGIHKDTVLSVKPGITGYWAANGRSNTSYEERVEMETFYANNMSISLDVEILCKTVVSVMKKEGAV